MSMSSPIHRLPPEILGKIFTSFRGPIELLYASPRPGATTTTLFTVCSQWRETALSIPSLWSWFVFGYDSDGSHLKQDDESRDVRIWQRTDKLLARAGDALLTIDFKCWINEDENYPPITSQILAALCSRASRWADLYCTGSTIRFFRHPAFQLAKGNLNSLFRIHFTINEDGGIPMFFADCPALRSISLFLNYHTDPFQVRNIAWQQIQKVSIDVFPSSQKLLLQLLRNCSNSDSLHLRLWNSEHVFVEPVEDTSVASHVSMNIKSLSLLLFPSFHDYTFLFERMSFSALYSIHIKFPPYFPFTRLDITPLLHMLSRFPSPTITFLFIERFNVSEQQWSSLLELMPNLETLEVAERPEPTRKENPKNMICTSNFFNKLLIDQPIAETQPRPPPVLPKLRRLILRVHRRDFDFNELYEALMSRCPGPPGSIGFRSDGFHSLQIIFYQEFMPRDGTSVSEEKCTSLDHTVGVELLKSLRDVGVGVSVEQC